MSLITILALYVGAFFSLMQVGAASSKDYKINDPLKLELWNGSTRVTHVHSPRCGYAEYVYLKVEFNPENQAYISPGCRTLGQLVPGFVDFILGCPKAPTTNTGKQHIKLYYTTDNDQVLDWNSKKEQKVRGDLKVVDTRVNKPDVAHIPVHVSLPSNSLSVMNQSL